MILLPRKRILKSRGSQRGFFTLPGGMGINGPQGGGAGPGAFPVLESTSGVAGTVAATVHPLTLPSGVTVGDMIVFLVSGNAGTFSVTSGTGWTLTSNASGNGLLYKIATGSDAVTITTSSSRRITVIGLRYSNTGSVLYTAFVNSASPPNLAPAPGLDDYAWIAVNYEEGTVVASAAPPNYSGLITLPGAVNNNTYAALSVAFRDLQAASEDPGAFTGLPASDYRTIAIPPP